MALSNLSKDRMLAVKDFTDSYNVLFKDDIISINLLGKHFDLNKNLTL